MEAAEKQFAAVPPSLKMARLERLKNMAAALEREIHDGLVSRTGIQLLLDTVIVENNLKNDAALSRLLEIKPSVISKLRHDKLPLGSSQILRIHEKTGMPVARIRELSS